MGYTFAQHILNCDPGIQISHEYQNPLLASRPKRIKREKILSLHKINSSLVLRTTTGSTPNSVPFKLLRRTHSSRSLLVGTFVLSSSSEPRHTILERSHTSDWYWGNRTIFKARIQPTVFSSSITITSKSPSGREVNCGQTGETLNKLPPGSEEKLE